MDIESLFMAKHHTVWSIYERTVEGGEVDFNLVVVLARDDIKQLERVYVFTSYTQAAWAINTDNLNRFIVSQWAVKQ